MALFGIPIIGDVIDAVKDIVSEVVVDKDKKAEINLELAKIADAANQRLHEQMLGQMAVNQEEAKHGSIFVAGWRPAVGWVCAAGLAAQVIVFPLLDRIVGWSMEFDTELLLMTMTGMLGIGGMRTWEKVKGVSTNDFTDVPGRKKAPGEPENLLPPLYAAELPEDAPWTT